MSVFKSFCHTETKLIQGVVMVHMFLFRIQML